MYTIMGATGNIGNKLIDILLNKDQQVKALGRSTDRLKPLVERGAETAVGDAADKNFLIEAFKGADAVFAMIPPNYVAPDFNEYQNEIGAIITESIEASGVTHVVNLSSHGAHLADKTGPIKGLYDQEQRLNKLEKVNILHLRPTYFMENLLMNIDLIKNMGINGGRIRGDIAFAMIATRDIAQVAYEHLLQKNFSGKTIRELLGPRDISLNEATRILGEKIGKPDLSYVQFSRQDYISGLTKAGLSEDIAQLLAEMSEGLNEGLFGSGQTRLEENITPTTFEEFADFFVQVYRS